MDVFTVACQDEDFKDLSLDGVFTRLISIEAGISENEITKKWIAKKLWEVRFAKSKYLEEFLFGLGKNETLEEKNNKGIGQILDDEN